MKKFILSLAAAAVVLNGCSWFDGLFVDEAAVHNGLVERMDAVLIGEGDFYDNYWALNEDMDYGAFLSAFDNFRSDVAELDRYFNETKFTSSQQVFVEGYKADYKPFIDIYIAYAGEFVGALSTEGATYESVGFYFEKLDQFTVDFVDVHNNLIDKINAQAG
ncbi:MAG: hypothetical protein ABIH78_01480 [Candidatus Peregrinibacteria bacterium]